MKKTTPEEQDLFRQFETNKFTENGLELTKMDYHTSIVETELGKVFHRKLSAFLGCEVIGTALFLTSGPAYALDIFEYGIPYVPQRNGKVFGTIIDKTDPENISHLCDPWLAEIWRTLQESVQECVKLPYPTLLNGEPIKFMVKMIDFAQFSRDSYSYRHVEELEHELKRRYQGTSFLLRINGGKSLFYLIFETKADLDYAERNYGLEQMKSFLLALCQKNDPYHIFPGSQSFLGITTNDELLKKKNAISNIFYANPVGMGWFPVKRDE